MMTSKRMPSNQQLNNPNYKDGTITLQLESTAQHSTWNDLSGIVMGLARGSVGCSSLHGLWWSLFTCNHSCTRNAEPASQPASQGRGLGTDGRCHNPKINFFQGQRIQFY